ncbi:Signal recognition particle protein [Rasamsonia emersonii CBS 393.64]|uniref:Signal recognition particle subunit SRP72 n=1 Tax=Rasamsonia emersonii (strain ATCC 16479 / CBS 393.64 / IMI 116815) TaxID=1408163 RepID=A0A0F4YW69_RASE3|nr:Signal recognition particle protein [Rasamsonia emersonii CBS 393.64]KKA22547.1 Signal recognition particle protein [Rasamsonia emersonii CBS 393.64]
MAAASVQSLSTLLQRASIEDHEEVLKACNAALKKSKNDVHAQHAKAVALLKLDRYDDALRVLEEGGDALKKRASLEYAYALYKCGKWSEAADVAARLGSGRGAKHVEAQASYRAEKFANAAEIYKNLSNEDTSLGNEQNDIRINTLATNAQLLWKREAGLAEAIRPTREDLEAFETTYNAACSSLARGDLRQSELLLKRAKELCKTSEYLSPEEKEVELFPIAIQELYVLIRQGKFESAEVLVKEISFNQQHENPYVLHKLFHSTQTPTDNDKLFEFQKNAIVGNSHSLDLLVQKFDGVIRSTSKALAQRPYPSTSSSDNILSVYNAAARVQDKTGQKAIQEIRPLLERRPKDVGLVLTVVQLYVAIGNITSAISAMENFMRILEESIAEADQDVRFSPGLVSVLVSLYQLEGRKNHIRAELGKAASYWRQRPQQPTALLRTAAASLLHSTDPSDLAISQELFNKIHNENPADRFATAGYVAAYATTDARKIEADLENLPPVQELVSDVDVAALEEAGVPQSSSSIAATAAVLAGARKRAANDQNVQSKKRVRKSRLPKEYDPNKAPDPERWLPLRERSTYRPKGKKGKQRAAERTQGGIVNEKTEEALAASTGQQQKGSSGGGGSSKKKKKGKR